MTDPSLPSDALEEPSFAGKDRRSSASVRPKEREGGGDRSNLTSGPPGPTVSDPVPVHAGVSGGVIPEYTFDVYLFQNVFFFLFYLKNRKLTKL